uniref:SRR1-like domain-containing protein n=1 Tax=Tetranychus urticae TaxID=32264 RepID=T1L246_TETUR
MNAKCLSTDGFTIVNRRRKGKKKNPSSNQRSQLAYCFIDQCDEKEVDDQEFSSRLSSKLDKCSETLKRIKFVERVIHGLSQPIGNKVGTNTSTDDKKRFDNSRMNSDKCPFRQFGQVVSYGIGRFSASKESLYQLSLLFILKNEKIVTAEEWLIYDPVFTDHEKKFLSANGFKIMDVNEKGARKITSSTFFYMPHCPIPMYNNLLWSNWSSSSLSKMVLLGTSFESLVNSFIDSDQQKDFAYLIHTYQSNLTIEFPLNAPSDIYEARFFEKS